MNLNGIGAPAAAIRLPATDPRDRVEGDRAPAPASAPQSGAPAATPVRRGAVAVPVEPPAGTDPELWAVLTSEERAFFARVGAMGPLTYGHVLASGRGEVPVARGNRLDVRG